jgi:hypothetical protein
MREGWEEQARCTIQAHRVLATASDLQKALAGEVLCQLGHTNWLVVAHAQLPCASIGSIPINKIIINQFNISNARTRSIATEAPNLGCRHHRRCILMQTSFSRVVVLAAV